MPGLTFWLFVWYVLLGSGSVFEARDKSLPDWFRVMSASLGLGAQFILFVVILHRLVA